MTLTFEPAPVRTVIDSSLRTRVINRLINDEGLDLVLAERCLDQALGLLQLCASKPNGPHYAPSPMVDKAWHALILYTKEYKDLCWDLCEGFIHHSPLDQEGMTPATTGIVGVIAETAQALRDMGFAVDEMLWDTPLDYQGSASYAYVEK